MRKSKTKKLAKAKADKYFSLYIRHRDVNYNGLGQCITCGRYASIKQSDAGHFINRDRESTRYDEKNCHFQCRKCNRFQSGNQYEHGIKIDEKYGEGTADKLLQKSKMLCKRTKQDYEWIAEHYKNKVDEL